MTFGSAEDSSRHLGAGENSTNSGSWVRFAGLGESAESRGGLDDLAAGTTSLTCLMDNGQINIQGY